MSGTAIYSGTPNSKFITKGEVKERRQNSGKKSKWGTSSNSLIGESSIIGDSSSVEKAYSP